MVGTAHAGCDEHIDLQLDVLDSKGQNDVVRACHR
jgi:hypothetical protein